MASGTRCRKVPPDPPYVAATANALRPTQSRPGPWWVPVTFDDLKQLNHNQRLLRLGCCGLLCPRVPVNLWEWPGPLAFRVLLLRDYEPNGVSRKITTARPFQDRTTTTAHTEECSVIDNSS